MRRGEIIIGISWGLVLFSTVAMLGFMNELWPSLEPSTRITAILTGIGALGTLFLAAATVTSVVQNQFSIREVEKDRERPLAKDELQHVIQPSIGAVQHNLDQLHSKTGVEWGYVEDPETMGGRLLSAVPATDPAALVRVVNQEPYLWKLMQEHNSKVAKIAHLKEDMKNDLKRPIRRYLSDNVSQGEDFQEELSRIQNAILMDLDYFGESSPMFDFWEKHGNQLRGLLPDEERELLTSLTREYEEVCDELLEHLMKRRIEVQNQYGISIDELPVDENPRWRGA